MWSADINGDIYVTDYSNNSIHVYSNSGILLRSFCSQTEGIDTLNGPFSLCVSGQYVYVVNYRGNYMSVFTTAGQYVTKFGRHGEGEGEFKHPMGVCVDVDGFVYVTECGSNRIQCF